VDGAALAIQEEAQRAQIQLVEGHVGPAAQLDPERGDGIGGLNRRG